MSKTNYVRIAEIVKRAVQEYPENLPVVEYLATELAGYFKDNNERFNSKLFLTACGVSHEQT